MGDAQHHRIREQEMIILYNPPWTETVTRRLIELYPDHITREISQILSAEFNLTITRNAVCGRCHRLLKAGMLTRKIKEETVEDAMPIEEEELQLTPPPLLRWPVTATAPRQHVRHGELVIYDLTDETCKWPVGAEKKRPPYRYCGQQTVSGRPYCGEHCERAYHSARIAWE